MIILDTNVIAEPMKVHSNPYVQAWLDAQPANILYLTSISLSELLLGIEILQEGKRKKGLDVALSELLEKLFGPRILPFDREAAMAYAPLISLARTNGRTISMADGQIAAIAAVHGFSVATRDTKPFVAVGVPVINPWKED